MPKIVYTTGVFDILHPGHIRTLRRARAHGHKLIVGVQEDESVFLQKGQYPAMSCTERMALLAALPFVDHCVRYSDIDQRQMLARLKPKVMVQTSEWTQQANRAPVINYLKEHNIQLIILPIKKKISSAEIKRRVITRAAVFRNDIELVRKQLTIKAINELSLYERFSAKSVTRLVHKIKKDNHLTNPITVARHGSLNIVIDGANRLEALKRLGAKLVATQLIEYDDERQVSLRNNVHFLNLKKGNFFALLKQGGIGAVPAGKEMALRELASGKALAICFIDNKHYLLASAHGRRQPLTFFNALVGAYINKHEVYRLSELSQAAGAFSVQIIFRRFEIKEIIRLIKQGVWLPSGITWHQAKQNIVRFSVPLSILRNSTLPAAKAWLHNEIKKKLQNKDIRYYMANTYICDEWK